MLPACTIVKLYLKVVKEITLQFESPFQLLNSAPRGGTVVAFCGRILALGGWNLQMLGANARGFPGVNPPGWPLISALTLDRLIRPKCRGDYCANSCRDSTVFCSIRSATNCDFNHSDNVFET